MQPAPPPYAVSTSTFAFPALAALAGSLPLGSGREAALAALLAARMAAGAEPSSGLSRATRAARATAARQWLPAMCPDTRVRAACTAVVESTADDQPESVAKALHRVIEVTASHLTVAARSELTSLAKAFERAD